MRFSLGSRRRSRSEILHDFNSTLKYHEVLISKLSVERRGLIDYEHSPYRTTNYEKELIPQDRLTIQQLSMNKVHEGRYLLCQLISGSYQLTSVTTIVEDPTGTIERLCLFNWSDPNCVEAQNLSTRRFIPIGTILVVRNPGYIAGVDGYPLIRSENPFDIMVIKNRHPINQGITWPCQSIENQIVAPLTPRMRKYSLGSNHVSGSPFHIYPGQNIMLTPPPSAKKSKSKDPRSLQKKSKRHKNKKLQKAFVLANPAEDSLSKDHRLILICCFLFFVWFVFNPY